jgi:ATP-dependent exoDNAse (exonuclease V) beta subunit
LPSPVSKTIKPLIKKDGVMVQPAKVNTLIFESVEQAREAIKKSRGAGYKKPTAADKINAKYDAELAALEQPATTTPTETINTHTTFDIIMDMISEKSFEDGRIAGNFADLAKDYLESGAKPVFNEKLISKEAYDSLFNESTGFLTKIKRMVDAGEMYLIGRDLVVYDSDITRPDGSKDRIAGEIDLLLATEDGIMIVDIKTGTATKWRNFNKVKRTEQDKVYSKREEYTLQQGAYATMLENMIEAPVTLSLIHI